MTTATPVWRWNPALRTSTQTQDGAAVVVIHDPHSGEYYQLGAAEFEIAAAFDGERSLEAVRAHLAAAGSEYEAAELEAFATDLAASGLLVAAGPTVDRPVADQQVPKRTGLQRALQIQVAAWKCEAFFAATVHAVRPFLRLPALGAASLLVGGALWIAAGNSGALATSLSTVFAGGGRLVLLWVLFGVIVFVHELAHGYVCAAFGGRVRSLGFMVMYGRPCAFCDVSDAWLLGKSQRLWVMAAGALVELVAWALATIVWRVTAPETWLNAVSLAVLTVAGVGTLFNFNPLLKFDGYYILSDGVEIPNLRQRAFEYLLAGVRRRPLPPATPRERRIFLAYGLLSMLYSVLVLGIFLTQAHRWVAARWGGFGVVLLWGTVVAVSAKSWAGALGELGSVLRSSARTRRWLWAGGGVVLVALLAGVRWPLRVSAECRLEPRTRVVVRCPVDAPIDSVLVREGEWVDAGRRLVRLATRDIDFSLDHARSQVTDLEAQLALLERGPRPQEIEMARRRLEAATTRAEYARRADERARQSAGGGFLSREAAEKAERERRGADEEVTTATQELELLQAGPRAEEVEALRARLTGLRSDVARLVDARERTEILAPSAGQVLSPHPERLVGRFAARGDSILVLADLRTLVVEIPVPEKDVADVTVGAPVRFKSRTLPGRVFEGSVVEIAPDADAGGRQHTVLVRSEVPNEAGLLRPGTTGFAKVYCGERPLGVVLARRGVRMLRTEFWALW